ncbi:hypothetical protein CY34DRAFT_339751 [Suillus luteus UH-Slu-Lm8-n1]|uniref:Uncharacterized protein n=1 Tax=Suillus luteus UH-Slu-Lm8-n1 TaxID=930992 RepID=A0A0D0ACA0_9AGAM|nr:hypothetical protein CY34DRAFT_339751 [Suillus luteus UH-Slu-Lm8-n1]
MDTPSCHSLHPHLHSQPWLHILVGSRLPTPARMPPTIHMPSRLQTAYALSNNQTSACMWTMRAGTDAPLTQGERTRTWIFHSPNAFSYVFTVLVSFFLLVPKPC